MDAAVPVDAQNAPTATWKTAESAVSHSAHRHHRLSTHKNEDKPRDLVTEAEDSVHCRTPKRRFASITMRGPTDHDDVDWLITMRRTN